MKKILALLLAFVMMLALVACGGNNNNTTPDNNDNQQQEENQEQNQDNEDNQEQTTPDTNTVKIGVVLVGDENEGYTFAHMEGIKKAAAACGLTDDNIVWNYNIPENEECYDKCIECVDAGCTLVITNSYSHQTYTQQAAEENPKVEFVAMTGDTAMKSGLPNFHNAFNMTFESRYVSGVVAGMKLKELMDAGKVTDPYIGYVGAFPYAEVVSGYTGFFLGIRSIVPEAHMDVQYTNSWFNIQDEGKAAEALMARGCVIIGQHADSTGAPKAVQTAKDKGEVVYSVGYNIDMLSAAPTAALTSSTNDWSVFYTYLFSTFLKGDKIATDWAEGYETGAVGITPLGPEVAEGTAEKVAEIEAAIKDGSLHVFDTKTFTVDGAEVTSAMTFDSDGDYTPDTNEGIVDGYYHESEYISAPSFGLRIDGITELN
ncbi:MAG: BMP family ABC transporter substrate-binding protein [Ruminococcaceae bacterium]|jgi:basic membrane protein A|nr:BMP family ABC transporter substrate-binding protein [Oscillospiraceae bacterium]